MEDAFEAVDPVSCLVPCKFEALESYVIAAFRYLVMSKRFGSHEEYIASRREYDSACAYIFYNACLLMEYPRFLDCYLESMLTELYTLKSSIDPVMAAKLVWISYGMSIDPCVMRKGSLCSFIDAKAAFELLGKLFDLIAYPWFSHVNELSSLISFLEIVRIE